MIRRYGVLALILSVLLITACRTEKNKEIFEDFEGEEGVYMIKLPPGLFLGMLNSESGQDETELGNIDYVKLLVFDETRAMDRDSDDIISEIREKFDRFGYEMAIQFSNSGNDISAYLLENEDYVTDLMIVINSDEGVLGLGLSGKLDGGALMNFASEIDYSDLRGIIDIDGFPL